MCKFKLLKILCPLTIINHFEAMRLHYHFYSFHYYFTHNFLLNFVKIIFTFQIKFNTIFVFHTKNSAVNIMNKMEQNR